MEEKAKKIRRLMIQALAPKESHHIGSSLSAVEILVYLYSNVLKINPQNPKDPDRDIFILSKGHGALVLYSVLCDKGFFDKKFLMGYDKDAGTLPEHASTQAPGVELSTGSLGHGLPVGNGFALGFRNDGKNNRVYVLMSDGELNEGSNWEAIMFAGFHRLGNLTAIIDLNGFQGYAETKKVIDLSPLSSKIAQFGWNVYEVDGHSFSDLEKTFNEVKNQKNGRPNMIIAKTIKGKGIPYFEGRFDSHYKSVDEHTKNEILRNLLLEIGN